MATDTDTQPWVTKQKKELGTWRQHFAFGADIKMLKISICYKGSKYIRPPFGPKTRRTSNSLPLKWPRQMGGKVRNRENRYEKEIFRFPKIYIYTILILYFSNYKHKFEGGF